MTRHATFTTEYDIAANKYVGVFALWDDDALIAHVVDELGGAGRVARVAPDGKYAAVQLNYGSTLKTLVLKESGDWYVITHADRFVGCPILGSDGFLYREDLSSRYALGSTIPEQCAIIKNPIQKWHGSFPPPNGTVLEESAFPIYRDDAGYCPATHTFWVVVVRTTYVHGQHVNEFTFRSIDGTTGQFTGVKIPTSNKLFHEFMLATSPSGHRVIARNDTGWSIYNADTGDEIGRVPGWSEYYSIVVGDDSALFVESVSTSWEFPTISYVINVIVVDMETASFTQKQIGLSWPNSTGANIAYNHGDLLSCISLRDGLCSVIPLGRITLSDARFGLPEQVDKPFFPGLSMVTGQTTGAPRPFGFRSLLALSGRACGEVILESAASQPVLPKSGAFWTSLRYAAEQTA